MPGRGCESTTQLPGPAEGRLPGTSGPGPALAALRPHTWAHPSPAAPSALILCLLPSGRLADLMGAQASWRASPGEAWPSPPSRLDLGFRQGTMKVGSGTPDHFSTLICLRGPEQLPEIWLQT